MRPLYLSIPPGNRPYRNVCVHAYICDGIIEWAVNEEFNEVWRWSMGPAESDARWVP